MWRLILIAACLQLASIVSQPIERFDVPSFWSLRGDSREQTYNPDTFQQRPLYDLYKVDERGSLENLLDSPPIRIVPEKRGFSMLAKWRPFNNVGKQRASIRETHRGPMIPRLNEFDIVSAETRGRPAGQPLRWG